MTHPVDKSPRSFDPYRPTFRVNLMAKAVAISAALVAAQVFMLAPLRDAGLAGAGGRSRHRPSDPNV
jgi:hypothetical protein